MPEKITAGQIAYEADCRLMPNYHDGSARSAWKDLSDFARSTWERNPTPREMRPDIKLSTGKIIKHYPDLNGSWWAFPSMTPSESCEYHSEMSLRAERREPPRRQIDYSRDLGDSGRSLIYD